MVRKRPKDRWKAKQWYTVLAPKMFGDVKAGETVADEPSKLIGRKIEMTLGELTDKLIKNSNLKLLLEIDEVNHNMAYTKFIGHKMDNGYLRSLARKGISKIDSRIDVVTKDGEELCVKSACFTLKRASGLQVKLIRKVMEEIILSRARNLELNKYIQEIILGKLSSDIYKAAKKVYPLRRVEITKTERCSGGKPAQEK
ncbi:MAG: 30S ribosomal protein S3ae [Methanophagales archaeon]|nr:30S ribosomal protein S3ae [Methanophagales archaeon]RLG34456.1 MAG: 30S ribosomal protein S3ae [Methanosarcinales archaeon]